MNHELNQYGQAVGLTVPNWTIPERPSRAAMRGRYCRMESLNKDLHGARLFTAISAPGDEASWTYMAYGPFASRADYDRWLDTHCGQDDPQFYAIIDEAYQQPVGVAAYLRIMPASGSIEVGHIHYTTALRCSRAATEAMALLMQHAFELGYRRYEWKCDALNNPSRAAAERLGFTFEGIFRQATIVKGRNRDTAWYSITDREWPRIQAALTAWLEPSNFDSAGRQKRSLRSFLPTNSLSDNS